MRKTGIIYNQTSDHHWPELIITALKSNADTGERSPYFADDDDKGFPV